MNKPYSVLLPFLLIAIFVSPHQAAAAWFGLPSPSYLLSSWGESVHLFFTFPKEQKINYLLQLTDKRVNEMSSNPSADVTNRYEDHYKQIENLSNQVQNKDQVLEKIRESNLRQQKVLAKVYDKVPEQAKQAILNAQENSSKNVAQVIENVEGSKEAQVFSDKTEEIQQVEQQGQAEQVPIEGSPSGDPSKNVPRELKGTNQERGLNPLRSTSPGSGESGQTNRIEPAQPIPMNAPVGQN